jgi:hypothetical protein
LLGETKLDQLIELRVQGDQIDAERAAGQRLRTRNLVVQLLRLQRTTGDNPESAGVGDRSNQVPLGHPRHGAAHYRIATAEKVAAGLP